MHITIFTVLMAVSFSTVLVLGLHFLRKKDFFLRTFGIHTVLLLYLLGVIRMLMPVEFTFTVPVGIPALESLANAWNMPLFHSRWNVGDLLILVWQVGVFLCLAAFLVQEISVSYQLRRHKGMRYEFAERILDQLKAEGPRKVDVPVRVYWKGVAVPMGTGLFHPQICLPDKVYSTKELYYILKHEYTHFCNRDLQIKLLVRLYCCLFWWNPAVWLLKRDFSQILEIQCDLTATKDFSRQEKAEYLAVILRSLVELGHDSPKVSPVGTTLASANSKREMVERFQLITSPGKNRPDWRTAMLLAFGGLIFAGSYLFVLQPAHGFQAKNGGGSLFVILVLLACCGFSGTRLPKKRVEEIFMFLLTEIRYLLSRALGRSVILVLAAVMLVISMGGYMSNLQAQQATLDHLADTIPVTARVLDRAGTKSTRIFIDTEHYDALTSMDVHDIHCTSGAVGVVAPSSLDRDSFPESDTYMIAANCFEAVPALPADRVIYGEEYGPGFLSGNQAACGISEPYAQEKNLALGDAVTLPVYTLTHYSFRDEHTYIGNQTLQIAAIYPYNESNGERTPDMVVPAAWLRASAEQTGEPFYYSSLSVNLNDPLHLTQFKENLVSLGFVRTGTPGGYGACDAISVEDELFIKTAEDLRRTLKIYRGFQVPFYGLVTGIVMLTVFLVLRSSRKDIAIASSLGEGRLRISFVHFSSTVLTQMLGGILASVLLVACTGITISDSLWILLAYLLCASMGTILAILQMMRFDTLSLLTKSS